MTLVRNRFGDFEDALTELEQKGRKRALRTFVPDGPVSARYENRPVVLFSGNDYLGLTWHPRLLGAYEKIARSHGAGAGASRLISGTSDLHAALEARIAHFEKKEASIVFSSGFMANWGAITALAGKDDFLVIDKLNHASIIDACRASEARLRVFPHKNYDRLEALLQLGTGYRRRLVISDSVFSMDGDMADLNELVQLKNIYGAWLMIDEAHATGVFGAHGAGLSEAAGVEDEIDIKMGTLSKACGAFGGFIAGDRVLIDYLRNHARSFIYSTALPAPVAAVALEAFNVIEEETHLREQLWKNIAFLREQLTRLGFRLPSMASPIFPLVVGKDEAAMALSEKLLEGGFFAPAIRPPTVPAGSARLRLTVSAAHTEAHMQALLAALQKCRNLWEQAIDE